MPNDKAQMLNEAQSPNYRKGAVLVFEHLGFNCHLDFEI
jgi:hypothetical protein